MRRMGWIWTVGLVLLGNCTPLGLWIYEDPVVTVSRVTLELRETLSSTPPVVVALVVKSERMEGVSTIALPLALKKPATSSHLRTLESGSHRFAVSGRATFQAPIGARDVRFAEEGDMIFGQRRSQSSP